ncbi:uncharacterized protein BDV14DRAFT_203157 [Aspergillus stella-maris]|uniref:uncharacterized protein n=1 Tax=Aspergillus stella-maris TaxID=1810926 RepID=UPI003CCD750D
MSNRTCSYASESEQSSTSSGLESASHSPAISTSTSPSSYPSPSPTQQGLGDQINIQHIELVTHLISDRNILSLGDGMEPYHISIARALRRGLEAPFLLYELLAFSARHLSHLHQASSPSRAEQYARQAMNLQTQGIALFNADKVEVDQRNCVAVCLFSVVLGHHLLTDTLSHRDAGLNGFLKIYVQCLSTHRGVFTVAMTGWDLLMETELGPVLSRSRRFTSSDPKGTECEQLKALIFGSESLNLVEKSSCLSAIRHLQRGFDALSYPEDENMRYQMVFLWTMLVPPEFTGLLAVKRPEALIILAYYALLLHRGRHIWQVRGAGRFIFVLIEEFLSVTPGWHAWLEYPRNAMKST